MRKKRLEKLTKTTRKWAGDDEGKEAKEPKSLPPPSSDKPLDPNDPKSLQRCFKCKQFGHTAWKCGKKDKKGASDQLNNTVHISVLTRIM